MNNTPIYALLLEEKRLKEALNAVGIPALAMSGLGIYVPAWSNCKPPTSICWEK